ncbi:MAG: hypothetical protein JWM80_3385 [Cyanobacteria bacterium RYN_339]|nr:hypothetical protein [Cyanobacteria bacterium RYN_339]
MTGKKEGPLRYWAVLLVACSWATPAEASTLPALDGGPGRFSVTAGILDAGVDVGIGQRLSLGATAFVPPVGIVGLVGLAGRATFWLTDPLAWVVVGATVSVGDTYTSGATSQSQYTWAQPAVNVALAPGRTGWALRGTFGPVASWTSNTVRTGTAPGTTATFELLPFVPNLEVAYRFTPNHELTLGGNGLIGWRGRF